MKNFFSKNNLLRRRLGPGRAGFADHAIGAIARILPHTISGAWTVEPDAKSGAQWRSTKREIVSVTISVPEFDCAIEGAMMRHHPKLHTGQHLRAIDKQEKDICRHIAQRASHVLASNLGEGSVALAAIQAAFDESVVAAYLRDTHNIDLDVLGLLGELHRLAQQTYENRAMSFGCIVDSNQRTEPAQSASFPRDFVERKKYRALSDGYRTAYIVSGAGKLLDFVELRERTLHGAHWYPEWVGSLAGHSTDGRIGFSLTRQGDILIFQNGSLRLSCRAGKWQYWNHEHLVSILTSLTRGNKVAATTVKAAVARIYRCALDVSFRRSGALFIVLRSRDHLSKIVRSGDSIGHADRGGTDSEFDLVLRGRNIIRVPRSLMAEVAGLDGAVVLSKDGGLLAYGAVLVPKRRGNIRQAEGARSKAAIGASNYGLALKVSSDGDIAAFYDGAAEPIVCV